MGINVDLRARWRLVGAGRNHILQLLMVRLIVFAAMRLIKGERFLWPYNFESMTYIFPELGILAIAMMMAMLAGGIDLSLMGTANLVGIRADKMFQRWLHEGSTTTIAAVMGIVLLLTLLTGFLCGTLNGLLIIKGKVRPILATMGTGFIFTGLCLIVTAALAVVGFPASWTYLSNGKLLGLALPFVVYLVISLLLSFVLSKTVFGKNLFLIGSNAKAALFSRIQREKTIFFLLFYGSAGRYRRDTVMGAR